VSSGIAVARVTAANGPDFQEAYKALDAEFGARGELERREVLEAWLARPPGGVTLPGGLVHDYHLLVARAGSGGMGGALVGARDCHTIVDPAARVGVVYLAHVWVAPAARRQGLGARFRAEALAYGARAIAPFARGPARLELLAVAEMERFVATEEATRTRLVAYGRDGFAAVDPARLSYAQPDFRDLEALGVDVAPRPVPLLLIVKRWNDPPGARVPEISLPGALAGAAVRHLYAVFATHVRADHVASLEARALAALAGREQVPLVRLPAAVEEAPDPALVR
jgi:GNAT superfamily N-acetyltransferase